MNIVNRYWVFSYYFELAYYDMIKIIKKGLVLQRDLSSAEGDEFERFLKKGLSTSQRKQWKSFLSFHLFMLFQHDQSFSHFFSEFYKAYKYDKKDSFLSKENIGTCLNLKHSSPLKKSHQLEDSHPTSAHKNQVERMLKPSFDDLSKIETQSIIEVLNESKQVSGQVFTVYIEGQEGEYYLLVGKIYLIVMEELENSKKPTINVKLKNSQVTLEKQEEVCLSLIAEKKTLRFKFKFPQQRAEMLSLVNKMRTEFLKYERNMLQTQMQSLRTKKFLLKLN